MANNLTRNPWIIDTASASAVKDSSLCAITFVTSLVWSGYVNAAHQVVIQDDQSVTLFTLQGNADMSPVVIPFDKRLPIRGLKVTTIDSGVLAIHVL